MANAATDARKSELEIRKIIKTKIVDIIISVGTNTFIQYHYNTLVLHKGKKDEFYLAAIEIREVDRAREFTSQQIEFVQIC